MEQAPDGPQGPRDGVPDERHLTCYRHPDRETGVRCVRCDRPICTDCMIDASVGFQCPECVRASTGHGPAAARPRTIAGGAVTADPRLLTKVLIGINLAMFLAIQLNDTLVDQVVQVGEWPPRDLFPPTVPYHPSMGVAAGEWYRLVSSMFAHNAIWHIVMNMLSLWWLGGPLEAALGRVRYLALYMVSGLAGSAFTYLLADPSQSSLGASGAIFGLLGATAVLVRRLNYDMRPVIALLVINLVFTFAGRDFIAWQAHVGGLVAGVVIAYGLVHAPRHRRALVQWGTCAVVLAVVVAVVLIRTAQLV